MRWIQQPIYSVAPVEGVSDVFIKLEAEGLLVLDRIWGWLLLYVLVLLRIFQSHTIELIVIKFLVFFSAKSRKSSLPLNIVVIVTRSFLLTWFLIYLASLEESSQELL